MDMTREQLFPLSLSEKWRKKHVSKNGPSDPGISCFREGVDLFSVGTSTSTSCWDTNWTWIAVFSPDITCLSLLFQPLCSQPCNCLNIFTLAWTVVQLLISLGIYLSNQNVQQPLWSSWQPKWRRCWRRPWWLRRRWQRCGAGFSRPPGRQKVVASWSRHLRRREWPFDKF